MTTGDADASGYLQFEHTADLGFELWAPTEEGMLVQGAKALVDLLTEGAVVQPVENRRVVLLALDAEDRLVRWLNHVLGMALVDGFLFADAHQIVLTEEGGLEAMVTGEPGAWARVATEVKAVTYHGIEIIRHDTQVVGRVVIDV